MGVLDAFKGGLRRSVNPRSLGHDSSLGYDWQNMDTLQLERLRERLEAEGTVGPPGDQGDPGPPGDDGAPGEQGPPGNLDFRVVEYGPWGASAMAADAADTILTVGFE